MGKQSSTHSVPMRTSAARRGSGLSVIEQGEILKRHLLDKHSVRRIAREMRRHRSTVQRVVNAEAIRTEVLAARQELLSLLVMQREFTGMYSGTGLARSSWRHGPGLADEAASWSENGMKNENTFSAMFPRVPSRFEITEGKGDMAEACGSRTHHSTREEPNRRL